MSSKRTRAALAASLAVAAVAPTAPVCAAGDPARGQALFAVCSTCHGQRAEGMREVNAPALAGLDEWYIVRQLENFKAGVRGTDPRDTYGLQMAPMAQLLADKQAIEDVAAYIRTFKDSGGQ